MPDLKDPITEEFNPGGARWCEDHNRAECTKRKIGLTQCHARAVRGTNACKYHAGIKRELHRNNGEARITAWRVLGDTAKAVEPSIAVLSVLEMTWHRLNGYSELLRRQVAAEGGDTSGLEQTGSALMPLDGEVIEGQIITVGGLIGHRYGAAGRDGAIFQQSEEVRALVSLEAGERDRVVKYAKVAHDMGVQSKLLALAGRWTDVVTGRVLALLDALDLTPEQRAKLPELLRTHLGSIDMAEDRTSK